MRYLPALCLALLAATAAPAQSQVPTPGPRTATLVAGIGNAMGWFGLQGEGYLAQERISLFGGLGYTPSIDEGDPTGVTVAAGVRGFTRGATHRGFLELSVSQVAIEEGPGGRRLYGPGLQAGWQYAARRGFTAMASVGLGYAPDAVFGTASVVPTLGLGAGYTWRRR
jgi:hypothetical protein